jgi:putative redox protein
VTHAITGALTQPLRTHLVHGPSGARLETVAPAASGGDGSRFSPIDLYAAALASCAATAMSIYAGKNRIALERVDLEVRSEVDEGPPRRIGKLWLTCTITAACNDEQLAELINAGRHCPVRLSLREDLDVVETFARA